jgi:hypothetical protein
VNPKRRKEGRQKLSFTGGDDCTAATAGTRGGDAGELVLEQASECVTPDFRRETRCISYVCQDLVPHI